MAPSTPGPGRIRTRASRRRRGADMGGSSIAGWRRHLTVARRMSLLGGAALLLAGCASFTPDGGMGPVAGRVSTEISKDAVKVTTAAEAEYVRRRAETLLARPL